VTRRGVFRITAVCGSVGLCLIPVQVSAQVSPGPLSRAHADLEGTTNCFKCHGGGDSSMDEQCVACHREIAAQVERGTGLHGTETNSDCATCHPDHAGADFELIFWDEGSPDRFDHTRTGWPLEGRHISIACRECHRPEFQNSPVASLLERKNGARSWLGLERRCLACHSDYHQASLNADCLACHGERSWKPAAGFDHSRTDYDLTGKHARVACAKCHLVPERVFLSGEDGQPIPRYKPVPHQDCSDCHADPHAGRLGPTCAGCHVVQDFHRVTAQDFDHSRTRYPLVGRHASVDCERCHDSVSGWGKAPPYESCAGCHRDAHAGQATIQGRAAECDECHDQRAFRPSTYSVERHRTASYPLLGRHLEVGCEKCHSKSPRGEASGDTGRAGVQLRPTFQACRDCHQDLHNGQLVARPDAGACESCHGVEGWKPSTYSVAQHAQLELPLAGRHAEVECSACHGPVRKDLPPLPGTDRLGRAGVSLTLLEAGCDSCHLDPHAGRFASDGPRPVAGNCLACHGVDRFRPAAVDVARHQTFAYPLQGGHRAVPCVECHAELKERPARVHLLEVTGAARDLPFLAEHGTCRACHDSPHGEQFSHRVDGGDCEGCHTLESFLPVPLFNHERDARFSLQGAHRSVACERCHPSRNDAKGGREVLYRPLPQRCQDCHGKAMPIGSNS